MTNETGWGTRTDMDCVIICGGNGSRMLPLSADRHKSLLDIDSRPLLSYIVQFWKARCRRFVLVTHHKAEQFPQVVADLRADHGVEVEVIVEERPEGIARALHRARGLVGERFVTVLGDCLSFGAYVYPEGMQQGIGVTEVLNPMMIHQSYSVEESGGLVTRVVEKPDALVNRNCGMGIYFFSRAVFAHIEQTPPSARTGNVELTDVIQHMADAGLEIAAVPFIGGYVNVTRPEDMLIADKIITAEKREVRSVLEIEEGVPGGEEGAAVLKGLIQPADRVLILRTVKMPLFDRAVKMVRATTGLSRLDVLCQEAVGEEIGGQPWVRDLVLFPSEGVFSFGPRDVGLAAALRQRRYDHVILLYGNPHKDGYQKLQVFCRTVCDSVIGITPPDRVEQVHWREAAYPDMPRAVSQPVERLLYHSIRGYLGVRRRARGVIEDVLATMAGN